MATAKNINIFSAIMQNEYEQVKLLLENGACPNQTNMFGVTLVAYATNYIAYEIVKLLLEYGADPNLCSGSMKSSPLICASYGGDAKIVELLLEHGANPKHANLNNWTPLMEASYNNNTEIMKLLIDYGADIDIINRAGKTALNYAGYNFIKNYLESKEHHIILK